MGMFLPSKTIILKQNTGGLVVKSATIGESPLLSVLAIALDHTGAQVGKESKTTRKMTIF